MKCIDFAEIEDKDDVRYFCHREAERLREVGRQSAMKFVNSNESKDRDEAIAYQGAAGCVSDIIQSFMRIEVRKPLSL